MDPCTACYTVACCTVIGATVLQGYVEDLQAEYVPCFVKSNLEVLGRGFILFHKEFNGCAIATCLPIPHHGLAAHARQAAVQF